MRPVRYAHEFEIAQTCGSVLIYGGLIEEY